MFGRGESRKEKQIRTAAENASSYVAAELRDKIVSGEKLPLSEAMAECVAGVESLTIAPSVAAKVGATLRNYAPTSAVAMTAQFQAVTDERGTAIVMLPIETNGSELFN